MDQFSKWKKTKLKKEEANQTNKLLCMSARVKMATFPSVPDK